MPAKTFEGEVRRQRRLGRKNPEAAARAYFEGQEIPLQPGGTRGVLEQLAPSQVRRNVTGPGGAWTTMGWKYPAAAIGGGLAAGTGAGLLGGFGAGSAGLLGSGSLGLGGGGGVVAGTGTLGRIGAAPYRAASVLRGQFGQGLGRTLGGPLRTPRWLGKRLGGRTILPQLTGGQALGLAAATGTAAAGLSTLRSRDRNRALSELPQGGAEPAGGGRRPGAGAGEEEGLLGLEPISVGPVSGADEYRQAIDAAFSRAIGSIEEQFSRAARHVAERQARGEEVLGLLPGRISGQFDTGREQIADTGAALEGELASGALPHAPGELGLTPAADESAPFMQALNTMETSRQADVPLLEMGLGELGSFQQGLIDQQRLEAMSEVERDRAAQMQRMQELELEQQHANRRLEAELAGRQQESRMKIGLERQEEERAQEEEIGRLYDFFSANPGAIDPYRGVVLSYTNPDWTRRASQTETYRTLFEKHAGNPQALLQDPDAQRMPAIASLVLLNLTGLPEGQ